MILCYSESRQIFAIPFIHHLFRLTSFGASCFLNVKSKRSQPYWIFRKMNMKFPGENMTLLHALLQWLFTGIVCFHIQILSRTHSQTQMMEKQDRLSWSVSPKLNLIKWLNMKREAVCLEWLTNALLIPVNLKPSAFWQAQGTKKLIYFYNY